MKNEKIENELKVFSPMEALTAEFKHKYDIIHDATTKEGYELVKAGIKDIKSIVKRVEEARVDKKSFYLESGRAIDKRAKEVTLPFTNLIEPMKLEKKKEDDRVAKVKAERLEKLNAKISEFSKIVDSSQGESSEFISTSIEKVTAIDPESGFFELRHEAIKERARALQTLSTMLQEKLAFEKAERERKELEEKQRLANEEAAIEKKVSEINNMVVDSVGCTSVEIQKSLDQISETNINEPRVAAAISVATEKMTSMLSDAKEMELQAFEKKKAKEEAERIDQVKKLEAEAAEKAEREAAEKIGAEQEKTRLAEQAAKDAEEKRKQDAIKAEKAKQEAAEKAEQDKVKALQDAEDERKRQEKIADDARIAREEDKKHRSKINNEAVKCLMEELGITNDNAKDIIIAIAKGKIKNCKIEY